jgi:hypothetical protein
VGHDMLSFGHRFRCGTEPADHTPPRHAQAVRNFQLIGEHWTSSDLKWQAKKED